MEGVLLIDKPSGWTSFDAVNYVRKMVASTEAKKPKNIKVGHTGTLDPLATGLLVLLIGKNYTKRAGELAKLDKTYEVVMKLGETSSTGDEEGEKAVGSGNRPGRKDIEVALTQFTGRISQTPPVYSAIKVGGQRAYELARKGQELVMEARPVTIHELKLIDYDYPRVSLVTKVSSGTYIRSLVEDIGQVLGTGAYTKELRRTRVGQFGIGQAAQLKDPDLLAKLAPLA